MNTITINNRVRHDDVESDLVYPIDQGYYCICKVEKHWIISQLRMKFGRNIRSINNKYAVEIKDRLYYNHDGEYWLIYKP